jgi:aminoglycoside 3-N-acetyltransferase
VLPLLHRAADGGRTLQAVTEIVATDRWNSFDRFHDTTRTLVALYEEAGARAEVYPVQTGGRLGSGRWIIHEAADVRAATAEIVAPIRRPLLDYAQNPWHVVQWSAATPEEGLRGELVVIDTEEELAALHEGALTGRFVLTRLHLYHLWPRFAEKGAAGVLTDCPIEEIPEATAWQKFGWGARPMGHAAAHLVGLVLSKREGERLRALLAAHDELILHVRVDARRYVGSHDVVSGVILGRDDPQDEVWALAHSAEPGALDNASGVAVCVEIARVIEGLIATGALPRPRRTIRLLNAYECYGFFKFLEDVRRLQTPLAGVVIDTVGSRPDVCNGRLHWHATVPASAGFVDRVGEAILCESLRAHDPGYQLFLEPFVETSDTLVGDPQFGFPTPWITTHYRDRGRASAAYHSSADTPDLAHPAGLAFCAAAMAGYLYYLADAGSREAVELAQAETERAVALLSQAERPSPQRARLIEEDALCSLDRLPRWFWEGERGPLVVAFEECRTRLHEAMPATDSAPASRPSGPGAGRVPRRTALLTPSAENTPPAILERIRSTGLPSWALFRADGLATLAEIAATLAEEYGREVSLQQVTAYFEAHAELGYVRLVHPREMITRSRLVADLRALGLTPGMDVMVHSSLSQVGYVRGGAATVVDALLQVIGPRGTLLAPSFNHGAAKLFNPLTTPTTNGAVADALWRHAGAVRSLHPTHSVAAIGPKAGEYCEGHLAAGIWAQTSPIGKLIHGGGYILSLGVTHESSTAYHVAEESIPCGCIDPFGEVCRVVTANGSVAEVRGLAWRDGECPIPPSRIDETLDRLGLQRHGKVGEADATLVRAEELWEVHRAHLKEVCPRCDIRPKRRGTECPTYSSVP